MKFDNVSLTRRVGGWAIMPGSWYSPLRDKPPRNTLETRATTFCSRQVSGIVHVLCRKTEVIRPLLKDKRLIITSTYSAVLML